MSKKIQRYPEPPPDDLVIPKKREHPAYGTGRPGRTRDSSRPRSGQERPGGSVKKPKGPHRNRLKSAQIKPKFGGIMKNRGNARKRRLIPPGTQ